MLRNYLITALRNITRNRLMTFLHVFGLALGFVAALLALLYVRHETTYDQFIPGHESVAVMVLHQTVASTGTRVGERSPAYFAGWMEADFPGIEAVRLRPVELTVGRGENETTEQTGWVDADFFHLLPLPVLAGDLASALKRPDAVVITRELARKYFSRDTPVGEILTLDRQHAFQVAAVIEDLPAATHLAPKIFGSALNREFGFLQYDEVPWSVNGQTPVITYIRAPGNTPASFTALQRDMPAFVQRHMGRLFKLTRG